MAMICSITTRRGLQLFSIAVVLILPTAFGVRVQAQERVVSGLKLDYLLQDCRNHEGITDDSLCGGYIGGAFDQLALSGEICLPENVHAHEIIEKGRIYLRQHTEIPKKHPAFLLKQAFKEAYPCKPN